MANILSLRRANKKEVDGQGVLQWLRTVIKLDREAHALDLDPDVEEHPGVRLHKPFKELLIQRHVLWEAILDH